jgi:signal transduction histidine kinase
MSQFLSDGIDDVVINSALSLRPSKSPNYEAENRALLGLAKTMAESPQSILQRLAETALRLCQAHTAGISLLETLDGQQVFRWEALAGVFADRLNHIMPRHTSPCGTTIDRNATQLMYMAERFFPAMKVEPPIVEALLIPFHDNLKPIGTVWVVSHDEQLKFDREDERVIRVLAQFASVAWQLSKARASSEAAAISEHHKTRELAAANEALRFQMKERERIEARLQELNKELEQRVLERTRELDVAYKHLRESQVLGAVGIAAAKIIHDLANPINTISISVYLLERMSENRSEVVSCILDDLKAETSRVQTLIAELRQFSRPLELSVQPVDLANLIGKVMHEARSIVSDSSLITFERDVPDGLPPVLIDSEKMLRALLNLYKNAIEAMPDGGDLALRCFLRDNKIVLEIEDSGSGIPHDMNVFDPFCTSKPNGWGLGLSIVHQIITAHRGTIEYVSESGRGTTFKISLPCATLPHVG